MQNAIRQQMWKVMMPCRKIAILASLAYGHQVDFEDIYTEGITKITDTDFEYAKKLGLSIKLLGCM